MSDTCGLLDPPARQGQPTFDAYLKLHNSTVTNQTPDPWSCQRQRLGHGQRPHPLETLSSSGVGISSRHCASPKAVSSQPDPSRQLVNDPCQGNGKRE